MPKIEEFEKEALDLQARIKKYTKLLEYKKEKIRLIKSNGFLKENNITLKNVHDTNKDSTFDYVHDNDKFDRLIREHVKSPWFSCNGFIYNTKTVHSGKSKWDSGTPVLLKDLK